jgi:hypothetical protein
MMNNEPLEQCDLNAMLRNLSEQQTKLIQNARLLRWPQHLIDVLVAAGDFLDDLDANTPDLEQHLQFISNQMTSFRKRTHKWLKQS